MSEWSVRVVKIGGFGKHPNADTLSITQVDGGYPCIFRTGEFAVDDLAVYIPVDSVVPDTEEYSFLKHKRIEAMRLRGIFSMGLLRPLPEELKGVVQPGDDVGARLGITKYVQGTGPNGSSAFIGGDCERAPEHFNFVRYSDHLPLRKYSRILAEGEEVVITEKLHGANARYIHDGDRLWCGSRGQIKKDEERSLWWKIARANDMAVRLAREPGHIFFGEVFGQVQDLKYGRAGLDFRVFDVFDTTTGRYVDFWAARRLAETVELPWVPVLYVGPWDPSRVTEFAEGRSTIEGADNIREGFVVKPVIERWEHAGRVQLKYPSESYLLRKKKTDFEDTDG